LRILAENLMHRNAAVWSRAVEFLVDESVIEAGCRGIRSCAGIVNALGARPIDCAEAHGARFAGAKEIAAGKLKAIEYSASFADRYDFGVSRGIVARRDSIGTLGNDTAIFRYDGAEWTSSEGAQVLKCHKDGAPHKEFTFGL
jgi:hypothetical protein